MYFIDWGARSPTFLVSWINQKTLPISALM